MEDRSVNQALSGGWYQWERRRYKEKVSMVEILCSFMEMEK
jgi:hypothetical protein